MIRPTSPTSRRRRCANRPPPIGRERPPIAPIGARSPTGAHDLAEAEAEIEHSHLDELTGAYMLGAGTTALQKEIDRARHSDERLVLAFVDVDEFKATNDRLGHAAGDAVLRDVVDTIRAKLRSYDPVVRVGGDEFICALSGIDLEMGHRRFAEIGEVLLAKDNISLSVGLAALQRGETLAELSARGDAALFEVKHDHREVRAQEMGGRQP